MRCRPLVLFCALLSFGAARSPDIPFTAHMIDSGASETAAVADVNKDGRLDIISGENWYEAPAARRLWAGGVDEAQVPRAELHQQLLRQLQRSAGRRRRRRLSGSRARHLVRQEDLLVEEPGNGNERVRPTGTPGAGMPRGAFAGVTVGLGRNPTKLAGSRHPYRLQHRVRRPRRHGQRRQGERSRRAGERHAAGLVRGEERRLDGPRGQRQELRTWHRRGGRQRRQAHRHPDAARVARSAGRSARRQLGVPRRLGNAQRAPAGRRQPQPHPQPTRPLDRHTAGTRVHARDGRQRRRPQRRSSRRGTQLRRVLVRAGGERPVDAADDRQRRGRRRTHRRWWI